MVKLRDIVIASMILMSVLMCALCIFTACLCISEQQNFYNELVCFQGMSINSNSLDSSTVSFQELFIQQDQTECSKPSYSLKGAHRLTRLHLLVAA